jgi:hypothetical protein
MNSSFGYIMCILANDEPFRRNYIKRTITMWEIRSTTMMIQRYSDWYVLIHSTCMTSVEGTKKPGRNNVLKNINMANTRKGNGLFYLFLNRNNQDNELRLSRLDNVWCVPLLQRSVSNQNRKYDCFYRCTVHFEDSLIITYQQMH